MLKVKKNLQLGREADHQRKKMKHQLENEVDLRKLKLVVLLVEEEVLNVKNLKLKITVIQILIAKKVVKRVVQNVKREKRLLKEVENLARNQMMNHLILLPKRIK